MFSISLDDRSITFNFPSKAVLLKENSWTNINRQHTRWKTTSEASEILLVDGTIRICFFSLHLVTMLMKKCETDGTYLFDVYMMQILIVLLWCQGFILLIWCWVFSFYSSKSKVRSRCQTFKSFNFCWKNTYTHNNVSNWILIFSHWIDWSLSPDWTRIRNPFLWGSWIFDDWSSRSQK